MFKKLKKSCLLRDNVKKCRAVQQHMKIWRMRTTCCITKATDIYSENVIFFSFSIATVVARTRLSVML
jgi:hypothetical protein